MSRDEFDRAFQRSAPLPGVELKLPAKYKRKGVNIFFRFLVLNYISKVNYFDVL